MQTLVRNIQLNFAEGEKKLTVGNLSLQKNYIHLSETDRFNKRGCLLTKEHPSLQTQFDLTGIKDCQLLSFDEQLQFTTVRYYRNHQDAPFSFFIHRTICACTARYAYSPCSNYTIYRIT